MNDTQFEILQTLVPDKAGAFLKSLEVPWDSFPLVSHQEGSEEAVLMDVDPFVLQMGASGQGAAQCTGGTFGPISIESGAQTLLIDGDVVVDGIFENHGLTVITGDLIARAVVSCDTYLLVLGTLRTPAFVGLEENYGTYICGDAVIGRAAFLGNHHMGVLGSFVCDERVHDELNTKSDVSNFLSVWTQPGSPDLGYFDLSMARTKLSELPMPAQFD